MITTTNKMQIYERRACTNFQFNVFSVVTPSTKQNKKCFPQPKNPKLGLKAIAKFSIIFSLKKKDCFFPTP